jgi:GntR family transcriptional regulator
MKIWLSKNSEVPVRDQLMTQITIGVLSGDLAVGEKLPSTREIARRFQIHANTVSSTYQKLADDGWLEFRKGSGFYIREADQANLDRGIQLDRLITDLFKTARELGFSPDEVQVRVKKRISFHPPARLLVIESDERLRDIIVTEVSGATDREVGGITLAEFEGGYRNKAAFFAAMIDEKHKIENKVPAEKTCLYLKARSVSDSMTGQTRPSPDDLIALVSGWDKFLLMAKTILVAANIDPTSLLVRRTDEPGWKKGLRSASMIICDSLTAGHFPGDPRIRPFRIVADESLAEIEKVLSQGAVN